MTKNPFERWNKSDKRVAVLLLQGARQMIVDRNQTYVCYALGYAADRLWGQEPESGRVKRRLTHLIENKLRPYASVSSWLQKQCPQTAWDADMFEYRASWIDEMIAQLEAPRGTQAS